jgi:hypothetical protein
VKALQVPAKGMNITSHGDKKVSTVLKNVVTLHKFELQDLTASFRCNEIYGLSTFFSITRWWIKLNSNLAVNSAGVTDWRLGDWGVEWVWVDYMGQRKKISKKVGSETKRHVFACLFVSLCLTKSCCHGMGNR